MAQEENPYKEIAAYEGKEITEAVLRILDDPEFTTWFKRTTGREVTKGMKWSAKAVLKVSPSPLMWVDGTLILPFLRYLERKTTDGLELTGMENLPRPHHSAFFITNHRDIILDAAFLSYLLRLKRGIRPYLGVGNNLFGKKWIEDLMRLNRCFAVIRNCGPREVMHNAEVLSGYIADRQAAGGSFWLAQREGRAKDGNDTTQPALLKMLTLAGKGDLIDNLKALHITPISITYDFDPCDYLKAQEYQLKRDNPEWKKPSLDDMRSMQTGLRGQKGKVTFSVTPCIDDELDAIDRNLSRNEQLRLAAEIIDRHIFRGYQLSWTNLAAKDILEGKPNDEFEKYLQARINLIKLPSHIQKDVPFLREKMLELYANPAINQARALD